MSNRTLEQVKTLITADLSVVEKVQLIEWLAAGLCQELLADQADQRESTISEYDTAYGNGASGFAKTAELASQHEIPWEERPWTQEELRELVRPDPKSGLRLPLCLNRWIYGNGEQWTFPMLLNGSINNGKKSGSAVLLAG